MTTTFKRSSFLFLVLSLVFFTTSCSSDDNGDAVNNDDNSNTHEVEYKITVEDPVIDIIEYKDATGAMVEVSESLEGVTTWSKTVELEEGAAIDTKVTMDLGELTSGACPYVMQIFVLGIIVCKLNL